MWPRIPPFLHSCFPHDAHRSNRRPFEPFARCATGKFFRPRPPSSPPAAVLVFLPAPAGTGGVAGHPRGASSDPPNAGLRRLRDGIEKAERAPPIHDRPAELPHGRLPPPYLRAELRAGSGIGIEESGKGAFLAHLHPQRPDGGSLAYDQQYDAHGTISIPPGPAGGNRRNWGRRESAIRPPAAPHSSSSEMAARKGAAWIFIEVWSTVAMTRSGWGLTPLPPLGLQESAVDSAFTDGDAVWTRPRTIPASARSAPAAPTA